MAKITNNSAAVIGVNAKDGERVYSVSLAPGQTKDFTPVQTPVFKARVKAGLISTGGKAEVPKANEAVELTGPFEVADKGRGWFVVMQGETEVTKGLRKDDVEGFSELSVEDQIAFVELNKVE